MKIISIFVIANAICVVQAETMFRMILNNGVADPELYCTAEDNKLITKVFDRPLNRRNLRSIVDHVDRQIDFTNEMDQTNYDSGEDRDLQAFGSAAYCKDECRGVVSGYCHKSGCTWYNKRRRLQNYGKGFLSNSTLCQTTSDSINSDLDFLVNQTMISSTCIALLQTPRKLECFEDVMFGIVDAFKVIDAGSDTELIPFLDARQTICNINAFNFQVLVNPCVKSVNITLYNKKANYHASVVRDTTKPGTWTLFGMAGNGKKDYLGKTIPLGNYTLEATPDGFTNKLRARNFMITQC